MTHELRIRTGTQTEVCNGQIRHRPIVEMHLDGRVDQFTGDWMDDEAAALVRSREIAAGIRARLAERGISPQEVPQPANRHQRRAAAKAAQSELLGNMRVSVQLQKLDDGKWYGAIVAAMGDEERTLAHSPPYDDEAEARREADRMAEAITRRFPGARVQ